MMLKYYACNQKFAFSNSSPDSLDSPDRALQPPRRDLPYTHARGQDDVTTEQTPSNKVAKAHKI
jgi:hypothetical protein